MSILLTGSNGFIGSYFINNYALKYNIRTFSFFNDKINKLDLKEIDIVFHLSALVHQMGGASSIEYEKVNVTQTIELAKKAKKSGVKQFIFMSTVKVYGEETNNKYTEKSICKPQDEYGKSKLRAEELLLELGDNDFKISIIRTPIVYGYGVKANIKNLISLVNKVSFLPFGNIQNNRSMVYIGNICHLVDEVIQQKESGIFLASDDSPLSTSNFIKLISKNLNKKVYLLEIPFFETLLKLVKPSFYNRLYGSLEVDNTITREKLNLKNPYTIDDGVRFMIKEKKTVQDQSILKKDII